MALMDEFKEEREKIKDGTLKEKLSYFWDYYKWYVIVPLIVIIFLGTTIYQKITAPEVILNGVLINAHNIEADTARNKLGADFLKNIEMDAEEYAVTLNTSLSYVDDTDSASSNYESMQALMAWIAAGSIDFLCGDYDTMMALSNHEYFLDLREVLNEEQIKKYEPYFLYTDKNVPIMIDLSKNPKLENIFVDSDTLALGITVNCPNQNTLIKFIDFLIEK